MIRPKLAVCAESVVRDAETNAVSVFNILEEIGASMFPVTVPKLSALFLLERGMDDPEVLEWDMTLSLGENELGSLVGPVDFQGARLTRLIMVIQGVVLPEPGILTASLRSNGHELGSWQIRVHQVEQSQVQPVPS
jgi:hypothetical protein